MKENIYLLLAPLLPFNSIISKLKDVFVPFEKRKNEFHLLNVCVPNFSLLNYPNFEIINIKKDVLQKS
jgi:hypothetical protein